MRGPRRVGAFEGYEDGRLEPEKFHIAQRLREAIVDKTALCVGELQLEQPPEADVAARQMLCQARQPNSPLRCHDPEIGYLLLEPMLELVCGDRDARVTTDGEVEHGFILSYERVGGNGFKGVFRGVVEPVSV